MIKPFLSQFKKCKQEGLVGEGPELKFKDHLEFLPFPFSKGARKIHQALEENPDLSIKFLTCLRFSANCSSSNKDCKNLRERNEE